MNFAAPLKIDEHLTLASRAIASPMAGVMGNVYCRVASNMGLIRNWITPFFCVSKGSVPSKNSFRKKLDPYHNGADLIVQLLGHDPDSLAETAYRLAEMGVNGVNLNLACPAPVVLKNGNGGAVLRDPELFFKIMDAVQRRAGGGCNVSVKIRTGFSRADELKRIADAVNEAGIRFVICHFRTVSELYEPVENPLLRLKTMRDLLVPDTILIGNGDIVCREDAERMVRETGCNAVAVGRALLTDPFILRKIELGRDDAAGLDQRMQFLRETILAARDCGTFCGRWARNGFMKFARMSLGRDSEEFRRIAADPEAFCMKNMESC